MRPKILHTCAFKTEFMKCISRYPCSLQIAVPYIGKLPGLGSIYQFSLYLIGKCDCKFQLITRLPGSGGGGIISMEEAKLISQIGVELVIPKRKNLHSKVYQFTFPQGDRAAFVGSANFTTGGFERNVETVAHFQGKEDNDKVAKELERIAWPAYNLAHWLADAGIQKTTNSE